MILLDSLYINNGGGKILLDYLVETLEINKIPVFYLFDERCIGNYHNIPESRKVFIKATIINRYFFYKRKKNNFSKVFCFGNLPPTIRLDVTVFTYFHQLLFLDVPQSVTFFNKARVKVKTQVLNALKTNTNIWFVQSETIKNRLASKYEVDIDDVQILPFYPPLKSEKKSHQRRKDGFVYISNGGMHKNHKNLIKAFCNFFDSTGIGILHLTISDEFPELVQLINSKTELGYPITNHGFIKRDNLVEIYETNEYLIFPSLAESFGLGVIEGIENGCKVIGADLPYTYAVCKPSLIFDPLDVEDMEKVLKKTQTENVKPTTQLVFNEIDKLIQILK